MSSRGCDDLDFRVELACSLCLVIEEAEGGGVHPDHMRNALHILGEELSEIRLRVRALEQRADAKAVTL